MYLFTRRVHARAGDLTKSMAWATGITERVHQITGLDVSLWTGVFGPQAGTLVWSTTVPDLLTLEAAQDKLMADSGYLEEASRGQQFAPEGANDRLMSVIHPTVEGPPAEAPAPNYAVVVDAVCSSGNLARGMDIGVRIAEKAEAATGVPTLFLVNSTGTYGNVTWITGFRDVEELERGEQALAIDPDFTQFLDSEAKGVFVEDPAATVQLCYRRIM